MESHTLIGIFVSKWHGISTFLWTDHLKRQPFMHDDEHLLLSNADETERHTFAVFPA